MIWIWIGFVLFILLLLALDLGVFHRKSHVVSLRESIAWSGVWVVVALLFSTFIWHAYDTHWLGLGNAADPVDGLVNDGRTATLKYLTGYVVEKSLSVDNLFVIAMLFTFFAVPPIYQHRVLFWGVVGALVLRGAMIAIGAKLIAEFHWLLYVFGGFLLLTGFKMLLIKGNATDPSQSWAVVIARRFLPVTDRFHGEHFLVRAGSAAASEAATPGAAAEVDVSLARAKPGAWLLTPLALALILVETTDLIFAVDSIPAIFAITADPFLVFTSNVFAILGLRSLYFALAGLLDKFRYLKTALAVVLILVGAKMLVADWLKALLGGSFHFVLLGAILGILATGVIASIVADARAKSRTGTPG